MIYSTIWLLKFVFLLYKSPSVTAELGLYIVDHSRASSLGITWNNLAQEDLKASYSFEQIWKNKMTNI